MYYSWLLLFVSFSVFSNMSAVPVEKRGIIPSNINIDIKLGKQNTPKPETPPGVRKTVLNAPFGLGSLTITTSHKNETVKPCSPETENISQDASKKTGDEKETLGGKGSAFFGPPPPHPPPHGFFGPPPPPYFHHHDHDCQHGANPLPPPSPSPYYTSTKVPYPMPAEKIPNVPNNGQSTTENIDDLIAELYGNVESSTSTKSPQNQNIDPLTGEGAIDVRIPKVGRS